MPRTAAPRDGDLPVFPSAQQYRGTTEVHTQPAQTRVVSNTGTHSAHDRQRQAPSNVRRVEQDYRQNPQALLNRQHAERQAAAIPVSRSAPQRAPSVPVVPASRSNPRQYSNDPRYHGSHAESGRAPPHEEFRRMNIQEPGMRSPGLPQSGARRPVLGVQANNGRASPHDPHNTNFVGQAFGIVPEDTTRAPPYDPVLWKIFCQVDSDGSGAITQTELAHALINGDFTPFHVETTALMIRLFDEDRNGTISFSEFEKLWKYLLEWKALFARFDTDHSGAISFPEFSEALSAFGYRLTTSFAQFLFRYHDKNRIKEMSFDLFVQSCVTLKLFTDVFRKFDTDMDGVITIGFEDFLKVMIKNR